MHVSCGKMKSILQLSKPSKKSLQRLVSASTVRYAPCAGIVSVHNPHYRDVRPLRKPFTRNYTYLDCFTESTFKMLNDNSKLILVEGNIGIDKNSFAKKIADEFNMKFMKCITFDEIYKQKSGIDLRELNALLPLNCRNMDFEMLHQCKTLDEARLFTQTEIQYFKRKVQQYRDAVSHILNTGEGVVLAGSCFNEECYRKALRKIKVFSRAGYRYYEPAVQHTLNMQIAPHLFVYLDAPVDYCLDLIKKRARPHEKDSLILTKEFLQQMEESLTKTMLPKFLDYSQILTIDVPNMPDWEIIVEDLEELPLDGPIFNQETKFIEWEPERDLHLNMVRHNHSKGTFLESMKYFTKLEPPFGIPELELNDNDVELLDQYFDHAALRYPDHYDHASGTY